jgi:hypothetical protein
VVASHGVDGDGHAWVVLEGPYRASSTSTT